MSGLRRNRGSSARGIRSFRGGRVTFAAMLSAIPMRSNKPCSYAPLPIRRLELGADFGEDGRADARCPHLQLSGTHHQAATTRLPWPTGKNFPMPAVLYPCC